MVRSKIVRTGMFLLPVLLVAACSSGSAGHTAAPSPTGPTHATFRAAVVAAGTAMPGWNVTSDYDAHATDVDDFAAAVEAAPSPADERAQQLALVQQAHVLAARWRQVAQTPGGIFSDPGADQQFDAAVRAAELERALRASVSALPR